MPTRPRGTSGRTTRSSAKSSTRESLAQASPDAESTASPAEVTDTKLERREIPSFSSDREARIAEAAYWRAERRGFAPGAELDDWLAAEKEIDAARSG